MLEQLSREYVENVLVNLFPNISHNNAWEHTCSIEPYNLSVNKTTESEIEYKEEIIDYIEE